MTTSTKAERYKVQEMDGGFVVYDLLEEHPVGEVFGKMGMADMDAFRRNHVDQEQSSVLAMIQDERSRQTEQWGTQESLSSATWLAVLTKQVGDVARALLKGRDGPRLRDLEHELIQLAATAVAWVEALRAWKRVDA